MVAAQDEEVLRVLDLVRQEETGRSGRASGGDRAPDRLERLLPAIDVVAQEQIVAFRRKAAVLEQSEQVVVLTVDVAADLDRRFELEQDCRRQRRPPRPRDTLGWLMKISRARVHRKRISYSCSWTCLPGRLPRTALDQRRRLAVEADLPAGDR